MKGRIMVDIADDDGALFQIVSMKADSARSCIRTTHEEQLTEFETALAELKAAGTIKRINQLMQ